MRKGDWLTWLMLFLKHSFGDYFLCVTLGDFTFENESNLTRIFKKLKIGNVVARSGMRYLTKSNKSHNYMRNWSEIEFLIQMDIDRMSILLRNCLKFHILTKVIISEV